MLGQGQRLGSGEVGRARSSWVALAEREGVLGSTGTETNIPCSKGRVIYESYMLLGILGGRRCVWGRGVHGVRTHSLVFMKISQRLWKGPGSKPPISSYNFRLFPLQLKDIHKITRGVLYTPKKEKETCFH